MILLTENLEVMDEGVFVMDHQLILEIVNMPDPITMAPIGIVLISAREQCAICGSKLSIRADRRFYIILPWALCQEHITLSTVGRAGAPINSIMIFLPKEMAV